MLKVGKKGLYVFDREGQHYQVTPPCVLDFYVHEKKQRSGLGKKLFEYMLERENVKPSSLAIDRPSEKFLNFLNKHYNLHSPVRQMNNYVVFDGFFPDGKKEEQIENSPINRTNGLQSAYANNSPSYGRYGAPRPPCSMGQIIHNTTSQKNSEPASSNNPQENFSNQQQYQPGQVYQQNTTAQQQDYYPVQNNYQASTSNNAPQRFVNMPPTPQTVNTPPQQRFVQQPQNYQQVSNTPQAQHQFPHYQQQHQFNTVNSPQGREVAENYGNVMMPQQINFDPNQRTQQQNISQQNIPQQNIPQQNIPQHIPQQNIPQHIPQQNVPQHIPQQNIPQHIPQQNVPQHIPQQHIPQQNTPQQNQIPHQMQEMSYAQQNSGVLQTPQRSHMPPQQPPQFQDQIRMFPEKEVEARRLPYQNVQYAENVQTNYNNVSSPTEYHNQPAGHIWPTQTQPQQVYQMSESVSQRQQNNVPFSQTPLVQNTQAQQFRQQQAASQGSDHFVRPHQQPHSPEYAPHAPRSAMKREDHLSHNAYDRNVHYQDQSGYLTSLPEESYVPQQTYLRQPERASHNVQKSHPPHAQHHTQPKHVYQPQHQQIRSEKQLDKQENQSEEKNYLGSETVQSLLQVDPKYFKPQPVQIKQPSETMVQSPTHVQRSYKQEETVDSLLRAEQEFFENGLLRDKYRIPIRYSSVPSSQHVLTADHQKFCPNHHEGAIAGTEHAGYPPQLQQHAIHRGQTQDHPEKRHYVPQEQVYENQKSYVHQTQKNTHPEQAPSQYSPPQQQDSQQHYITQQQYTPGTREQDQYQAQGHYIPREQNRPPQVMTEQNYAQYTPTASPQHYTEPEFYQPEVPQNTNQYQSHQQYHQSQQRYEPVQNVSQEMSNPPRQSTMDTQQVQYVAERRPELEDNRPSMPSYQEPNEKREVVQYNTNLTGSAPSVLHEPQVQQLGDTVDSLKLPEKLAQESVANQPRLQENVRQSSYIANDFNPHAEGPGRRNPEIKNDRSIDQPAQRKKRIDRQYGLNETDMRRKAYKSAIIKRTEAQEQDTLEFGYPPQVDKKRPAPRNILTMRGR
ncbi:hypothetical protein WA026_014659 [Henosepilachna vigintioctopunctata]|uniref:N-acetyltransferase domain-containing protein n=1 Tax=Henosepilachna vigintioctopunctata TaxID=420089 RepID=A0AAW1VGU9_9CUCU